jgi:hypothetical protein
MALEDFTEPLKRACVVSLSRRSRRGKETKRSVDVLLSEFPRAIAKSQVHTNTHPSSPSDAGNASLATLRLQTLSQSTFSSSNNASSPVTPHPPPPHRMPPPDLRLRLPRYIALERRSVTLARERQRTCDGYAEVCRGGDSRRCWMWRGRRS